MQEQTKNIDLSHNRREVRCEKTKRALRENVSPPGQKLHSHCRFFAEEFPEEKTKSLSKADDLQFLH